MSREPFDSEDGGQQCDCRLLIVEHKLDAKFTRPYPIVLIRLKGRVQYRAQSHLHCHPVIEVLALAIEAFCTY